MNVHVTAGRYFDPTIDKIVYCAPRRLRLGTYDILCNTSTVVDFFHQHVPHPPGKFSLQPQDGKKLPTNKKRESLM